MKKAEFDKLTADMNAANRELVSFMDRFSRTGTAVGKAMSSEDDSRQATALLNKRNDVESKWLEVVRSGGPIE